MTKQKVAIGPKELDGGFNLFQRRHTGREHGRLTGIDDSLQKLNVGQAGGAGTLMQGVLNCPMNATESGSQHDANHAIF